MSPGGGWVLIANGYGLVVMTLASHARGRGFDPLFPYAFCFSSNELALSRVIPGSFGTSWHPGCWLVLGVVLLLVGHHEGESLWAGLSQALGRACIARVLHPALIIVLL